MAIVGLDYFYDGQTRRFLQQIVRAFSGFQYMTGKKANGQTELRMVPCRMAHRNRMVAQIMANNSETTLLTVPIFTVDLVSISGRREDVQSPTHVDKRVVVERAVGPNGEYLGTEGNRYTVERVMPRPFEATVQVDLWTSNQDQKFQLTEQVLPIIYPGFSIQNSDNPLDWSARTDIHVEDVSWTSRSVPVGTESEIDIFTITLRLPFWLNPPASVTRQKIVHQINTNVGAGNDDDIEQVVAGITSAGEPLGKVIVTPGNHWVRVDQGRITLLGPKTGSLNASSEVYSWADLISQYGALSPTISQLRLILGESLDDPNEIVGTIQESSETNELIWTIDPDTLPSNTMNPVNALVDPLRTWPGEGLVAAANGQRYLLTDDITNSATWSNLTASANDIIQYTNGVWSIVFDASLATQNQYVRNLYSNRQLRWETRTHEWVLAIEGDYGPGKWRLFL